MKALFVFFVMIFLSNIHPIKVYLSNNLQGRFNAHETQSGDDFMLDFAASLLEARSKEKGIYLDLGNAFYPGALSRFSYGAITADFFVMLNLDVGLIAANDLNLGADNLNFIRRTRKLNIISTNIRRKGKSLFPAYHLIESPLGKLAFLGLSSPLSNIDYAEKEIFKTEITEGFEELREAVNAAKSEGAEFFVLLSGWELKEVFAVLERFREIDLVILGGDYTGELFSEKFQEINLSDGRQVFALNKNLGYYEFELSVRQKRLFAENFQYFPVRKRKQDRIIPDDFLRRYQLWLNGYLRSEAAYAVPLDEKGFSFDAAFLGALTRRDLRCEVAIMNTRRIRADFFQEKISPGMIRERIYDDYRIFVYRLTGEELEQIQVKEKDLLISGLFRNQIQGYPLGKRQEYLICSSQSVLEKIQKSLGKVFYAQNTWLSHGSLISHRIKNKQLETTQELEQEVNRLWRFRIEGQLSNLFETASVQNSTTVRTPPGQPRASYSKYGLENSIDFYFYNQRHEFILSPYLNYVRQDDLYLQNLLRGSFTYNYHPDFFFHPYHKSQIDTVVREVNNQRPTLIRETLGVQVLLFNLTGRLGVGFEKKVLDPVDMPFWGFETTLKFGYNFWQRIIYRLSLDTFFSSANPQGRWQVRSEIINTLTFPIYEPLSLSIRHRWFYFYSISENGFYDGRLLTLSLDLRTNLKIF